MKLTALLLAAGGFLTLAATSSQAMPVGNLGANLDAGVSGDMQQVRLVCNRWGRCWRTGPRYYRYGYGPRYYAPAYGYAPGYYRPYGYGYGRPGIGFGFRF